MIASIIKRKYANIYFVDFKQTSGTIINEEYFFNKIDQYKNEDIFIGVGSNSIRKKIFDKLFSYDITPANCIAENTFIAYDAVIANGVVICPGSVIGSKAIIGNNTIVNTLSSVDHDCILGDHSQVTAGVIFGGTTIVGENCFFGIKSATIPNISIGNNSIIMAGSIVYKDVPADVMIGGNPARIVKNL
ncbi:MAG: acetyltransferase [Chitinophagaceae bacterium]|nr:acetyltransferase [Chitinophagaceae bacterium]